MGIRKHKTAELGQSNFVDQDNPPQTNWKGTKPSQILGGDNHIKRTFGYGEAHSRSFRWD